MDAPLILFDSDGSWSGARRVDRDVGGVHGEVHALLKAGILPLPWLPKSRLLLTAPMPSAAPVRRSLLQDGLSPQRVPEWFVMPVAARFSDIAQDPCDCAR